MSAGGAGLPLRFSSIARQKLSTCAWLRVWRRLATESAVALPAGKLSVPAIDAKLRRRATGSRVAEGDERSELALDAAGRLRHTCTQHGRIRAPQRSRSSDAIARTGALIARGSTLGLSRLSFARYPTEPVTGPPLRVGDGKDADVFAEIHEDHRVRKPREQCSANHHVLWEIKQPGKMTLENCQSAAGRVRARRGTPTLTLVAALCTRRRPRPPRQSPLGRGGRVSPSREPTPNLVARFGPGHARIPGHGRAGTPLDLLNPLLVAAALIWRVRFQRSE